MTYIIGQICGLVVTALSIIMPFYKKKWQMLVNIIGMNLFMALNYLLIGAFGSAMFMCAVAVVQSILSLVHTLRETKVTLAEQIVFFVLYLICGVLGVVTAPGFVPEINFKNLLELLPIIGAVLNMVAVFVRDEQDTRKYMLINASVWSVYTAAILSTTFFAEIIAVISNATAMYKYRKTKNS